MSALAVHRPTASISLRRVLVAGAAAVAGLVVALLVLALLRPGAGPGASPAPPAAFVAPGGAFALAVPAGWTPASPTEVRGIPSRPLAVLRRGDHRGLVVVTGTQPLPGDLRAAVRTLTARLRRVLGPVTPVSARIVPVRSGSAFLFTFARGATVQGIAVATVAGRTYAIDGVVPAGAADVAQQVGAIVASFGAPR